MDLASKAEHLLEATEFIVNFWYLHYIFEETIKVLLLGDAVSAKVKMASEWHPQIFLQAMERIQCNRGNQKQLLTT